MVAAGRGDLEGVPAQLLSGQVGQVGAGCRRLRFGRGRVQQAVLAADVRDQPVQRVDRPHGHAGHHRRLAGVAQGDDHPGRPGPGGRRHHRQHSADRAHRTVQTQLAQQDHARERRRR
nr:hypothetical protein GCM10020092_018060 [Actinoplanes digitatis]